MVHTHYTLNDGTTLPAIGFGTYLLNGRFGKQAIVEAIQRGYRLLDSAFNYENEGAVGAAVRTCGVPRDELIVTSKLSGRRHSYQQALVTIEESLYRTGLDYLDIYLIHWPNPKQGLYVEAWQALVEARKRGYVKTIGVCNFIPEYLEKIIAETGVTPAINQIELHPYFNQADQRAWDAAHGIVDEAWSPVARGNKVFDEPVLKDIAASHGKTVTQIILRWHLQLGTLPLPKAKSENHQTENLALFDFSLSDDEMNRINALSSPDGRNKDQDPRYYEEF